MFKEYFQRFRRYPKDYSSHTVEASNYLKQSEAAYTSMPFLRDRIIEEWTAKGYKVTYDDGDSILIEKADDN